MYEHRSPVTKCHGHAQRQKESQAEITTGSESIAGNSMGNPGIWIHRGSAGPPSFESTPQSETDIWTCKMSAYLVKYKPNRFVWTYISNCLCVKNVNSRAHCPHWIVKDRLSKERWRSFWKITSSQQLGIPGESSQPSPVLYSSIEVDGSDSSHTSLLRLQAPYFKSLNYDSPWRRLTALCALKRNGRWHLWRASYSLMREGLHSREIAYSLPTNLKGDWCLQECKVCNLPEISDLIQDSVTTGIS